MLDPKLIRTELNAVAERLKIRNVELNVAHIQSLESARKEIQTRTEEMLAKRNARSKMIGKAKSAGQDIQPLLDETNRLKKQWYASKDSIESAKQMRITAQGYIDSMEATQKALSNRVVLCRTTMPDGSVNNSGCR